MAKEIIYRKLVDLKKLPNNPRTIKKDDMARLKQSIKDNPDYFEARPIILSNRTGELVILAGNQRYEAAKALKMDEVPTFLLEGLTEAREREIIIRDNVSNGDWDMDALANEWDIDLLQEWGVEEIKNALIEAWECKDKIVIPTKDILECEVITMRTAADEVPILRIDIPMLVDNDGFRFSIIERSFYDKK